MEKKNLLRYFRKFVCKNPVILKGEIVNSLETWFSNTTQKEKAIAFNRKVRILRDLHKCEFRNQSSKLC